MKACPHWTARVETGAWTLEREGEYAGMWVHGLESCRLPSPATLLRVAPVEVIPETLFTDDPDGEAPGVDPTEAWR